MPSTSPTTRPPRFQMSPATRERHLADLDTARQHTALLFTDALLAADTVRAGALRGDLARINASIARMKLPTPDPVASRYAALEERLNGMLAVARAGMRITSMKEAV